MKIYVDIDGTILKRRMKLDYENSLPLNDRIKKINDLYDSGNEIIYWTARGTATGIDWYEFTKNQLDKYGVKYHSLLMGKPEYDLFIDDKNINALILDHDQPLNESVKILKKNKERVIDDK